MIDQFQGFLVNDKEWTIPLNLWIQNLVYIFLISAEFPT